MSLGKVKKLIALAAQDNEEGRTAAWLAVKLIREHDYRIERAEKADARGHARHHEPAPPQPPPAYWRDEPPYEEPPQAPEGEIRPAKSAGKCWSCERPWRAGESVFHPPRRSAICLDCARA